LIIDICLFFFILVLLFSHRHPHRCPFDLFKKGRTGRFWRQRSEGDGEESPMNWVVYCIICGSSYVYESGQDLPEICPLCSTRERKEGKKLLKKEKKKKEVIAISTSEFKNRKVVKTLGMVSHEHIFGINLDGTDLKKFNREISVSWAEKVNEGRDLAISSIEDKALDLGGNAVVGTDITYNVLGTHSGMVMMLVAAKGTAVVVE
jgi:uncharacterized protein YbjQ (UPF0145 family)